MQRATFKNAKNATCDSMILDILYLEKEFIHSDSQVLQKVARLKLSLHVCYILMLLSMQGLVKLLASNPADKEVLQATAKALKQMTAERPAFQTLQRSGSRWLRVLSRQASAFIFERMGLQVSPAVLSIVIISLAAASSSLGLALLIKSVLGRGKSVQPGKKVA